MIFTRIDLTPKLGSGICDAITEALEFCTLAKCARTKDMVNVHLIFNDKNLLIKKSMEPIRLRGDIINDYDKDRNWEYYE